MSSTLERENVQVRELECNSLLAAIKENGILHDFSERGPFEALLVPVESVLCSSKLASYLRLKRPKLEEIQSEHSESKEEKQQQQKQEEKVVLSELNKSTLTDSTKRKDTHVKWWDEKEEVTHNDKLSNISVSEYYEIADVLRLFLKHHLIHFDRSSGSCFTTAIGHRGEFSELLDSVQRYGRLDKSNVVADADSLFSTMTLETALQQYPEINVNQNGLDGNNTININNNNTHDRSKKHITSEVKQIQNNKMSSGGTTRVNNEIKQYHPLRLQLFFIDNVLMEKHELSKLQSSLSSIVESQKKQKVISNIKDSSNISSYNTASTKSNINKFSHSNKSNYTGNNHVVYSSKKSLNAEVSDNKQTSSHIEKNAPSSVVNNLLTRISKQPMLSSPPMQRHKIVWLPPPHESLATTGATLSSTSTLENLFDNTHSNYINNAINKNNNTGNVSNETVHTHHTLESPKNKEEEKSKEEELRKENIEKESSSIPDYHDSSIDATKTSSQSATQSPPPRPLLPLTTATTGTSLPNTVMSSPENDETHTAASSASKVEVANNYNSDGEDDIVVIDDFTPYVTKTNREDTEHTRVQVNTHEYSQESIENYRRVVAIDNEVYYDEFAQLMIQRECEKLSHLVTGFVLRGQSEERVFHSHQPFVRLMNRCLREIQNLHYSENLPHKQTVLAEGIEKYVTTKLYRFIFDVSAQEATINNKLQQRLGELDHLTALQLDALTEIEHKYMWGQAMFELDAMNFFRTPRDKLRCGMRACEMLSLAVGEILTSRKQERKFKEELLVEPETQSSHTTGTTSEEGQEEVKTEKGDVDKDDNDIKNDNNNNNTTFDNAGVDKAIKVGSETITSPTTTTTTTNITSPRDSVAVAFGADEFLPCFMLLVLRARPLNFYQNIQYINKYRTEWLRSDEESYCLANLLSAAEFWLNCNDKGEWEQSMGTSPEKTQVDTTLSTNIKSNVIITTSNTVSEGNTVKDDNNHNNHYGFIKDSLMRKLSNSTRQTSREDKTATASSLSPSCVLPSAPVLHEKDLLPSVREVSAINKARRATDVSQAASHDNSVIAGQSASLASSPSSPELSPPPPELLTSHEFCLHEIRENNVDNSYSSCSNSKSEHHHDEIDHKDTNANVMITKAPSTSPPTSTQTTIETTVSSNTAPHSVIDALFGWTSRARVGSPLSRVAVKNDKNMDLNTEKQTVSEKINESETFPSSNETEVTTTTANNKTTEHLLSSPSSTSLTFALPQQSLASPLISKGSTCAAPLQLSEEVNNANKELASNSSLSLLSQTSLASSHVQQPLPIATGGPQTRSASRGKPGKVNGANVGLLGFDVMSMFGYTSSNNNSKNNNTITKSEGNSNEVEINNDSAVSSNFAGVTNNETKETETIETKVLELTQRELSKSNAEQYNMDKNDNDGVGIADNFNASIFITSQKAQGTKKHTNSNVNVVPPSSAASTIHQLLVVEKKSFDELSVSELRLIVEEARQTANTEERRVTQLLTESDKQS